MLALAACAPLTVLNAVAPSGGVASKTALAYGDHARQKLDLYWPKGTTGDLPTVLFLYGGSWKGGERGDYAFAGRALAARGFLVAVADYRVYPEVQFPAFVEDAAAAVTWLTENADNYGGQTRDIHLIGHSAGAHIVAMLALDGRYLDEAGPGQGALGRWVGLAGPYAFHPSHFENIADVFANLDDEDRARPIVFAGAGDPPALLLHGADDTTVVPEHSRRLADVLTESGVPATAYFYDGIGHVKLVLSLTPPFQGFAPALDDTTTFLKTGTVPSPLQKAAID